MKRCWNCCPYERDGGVGKCRGKPTSLDSSLASPSLCAPSTPSHQDASYPKHLCSAAPLWPVPRSLKTSSLGLLACVKPLASPSPSSLPSLSPKFPNGVFIWSFYWFQSIMFCPKLAPKIKSLLPIWSRSLSSHFCPEASLFLREWMDELESKEWDLGL